MTLSTWFICWLICTVFGSYVLSCIRHYLVEEAKGKAKLKIVDLFVASLIGAIPGLNFLLAALSVLITLIFIVIEVYSFHSDFFDKEIFSKKKLEKTKDEY